MILATEIGADNLLLMGMKSGKVFEGGLREEFVSVKRRERSRLLANDCESLCLNVSF